MAVDDTQPLITHLIELRKRLLNCIIAVFLIFLCLVYFANDIYDAVLDADAALLVTEWKEFRMPSWKVIHKSMKFPLVLDGRNIYEKAELEELGFEYEGIGWIRV